MCPLYGIQENNNNNKISFLLICFKMNTLIKMKVQIQCKLLQTHLFLHIYRMTSKLVISVNEEKGIIFTLKLHSDDFQRCKSVKGSRSGVMVSALVPGASSPGLNLAGDTVLCSWARHLTLTVSLSTQKYK